MKKYLCTMLGLMAAATMIACSDTQTTVDVNEEASEAVDDMVGMPNPLEDVNTDEEFLKVAGFAFDSTKLEGRVESRTIISDTICQVSFVYDDDGEEIPCLFRGIVMDEYYDNLQGIYDEIESSEHFGYGLGEEVIDVLEIKYANTEGMVYEFIVEDNSTGQTRQVSLEVGKQLSDEKLADLLQSVLWAMNAF